MQDLTVTGNIQLPNAECTINVKGQCSVERIERTDSGAAQSVTVKGEDGAILNSSISVPGKLTLDSIVLTGDEIYNGTTNQGYVLKVKNSDITLHHQLMWMTADGMDLTNSSFKLDANADSGQFWVQKIAMDENSRVESYRPMQNYGHFTPEDLGIVNDYIADPAGGRFEKKAFYEGAADVPLTVVDKEGKIASHFILKAPKDQCEISLKASPAEGGTVSGAGSYDMDSAAAVKAEANKGYHFVQWEDEQGVAVSRDAAYTFKVTETKTLTAVFAKDSVAPAQAGGSDQGGSNADAVQTGDSSHMELWIALLAASLLGAAGTVMFRKHRA